MTSVDALDTMDNCFTEASSPLTPDSPISPARIASLCNNNNHSRHSSTTSEDLTDQYSPGTPKKTLTNREHVKLRLTRSYDPNLSRHRLTAPEPGVISDDKNQNNVNASELLKEREAAHAKLRTVKSFEDTHAVLAAHRGPDSPNVSSPRLRKKHNYLQKMAIFFHHGPRSSSASSSPMHSEDESHSDTEFGFDVSPLASPTVMHKGKSPLSPSSRLIPKKWRIKSSSPKLGTSTLWSQEGHFRWTSMSGRTVQLTKTLLVYLSEMERTMLQKVSLQCLQEFELGAICIPKDGALKRCKKSNFSLKGRSKNTSFLDNLKDNFKDIGKENKDPGNNGLVFGIPIAKCILNDVALQRRRSSQRKERRESLDLANTVYRVKPNGKGGAKNNAKETTKKQSMEAESEKSSPNASLLEALSLSTSSSDCHRKEKRKALMEREPQVPHIVSSCFSHIENHGLRVLGIFRVGGSKKRIKQLREEFDNGSDVRFHEGYNPHDVAALLKEYFRDLPEPLLSRELYPAFIATSHIENPEKRVKALHYLVCLLPLTHADTLYVLMKFLSKVASCAKDSIDTDGSESPGNKMDSHNLATLFGPNILHKLKGDKGKEFHSDGSSESVEESREIIEIVKSLIEHHEEIFQVSAETHNDVIKYILESDVEALDFILNRISAVQMGYRQSTSESSVWEGSDISSMPPTPNSDIQSKTSSDPNLHHAGNSITNPGNVSDSSRTASPSPKSPPAVFSPTQPQHIKSVSFTRGTNDRAESPTDMQARLTSQTANMGVKKKKIPPPRLNLSKMSANPVGDLGMGGIHSPPISPLALPSYQEHMDGRMKCTSPTDIGRQNNNQIKTVSSPHSASSPSRSSPSRSSPSRSGRMIINASPLSTSNSYSISPPIDPWENLYGNKTPSVSSKGQFLDDQRNDHNGAKSVTTPHTGKEHGLHDWQRDQWLQWRKVATDTSTTGDMYEQETLV